MKLTGRQSKNIEVRKKKSSRDIFSGVKDNEIDKLAAKSKIGMKKQAKRMKENRGRDNRYPVEGEKNTDFGSVPVPEDKPFLSGKGTQKWKGKGK